MRPKSAVAYKRGEGGIDRMQSRLVAKDGIALTHKELEKYGTSFFLLIYTYVYSSSKSYCCGLSISCPGEVE